MDKTVCGATTRKGTPCQKAPLKNGRCRLHGGKSTGPKDKEKHRESLKGNKNAVITGEYETISFDTLLEDEQELINKVPDDPHKLIMGSIAILEIRKRRILQRYTAEKKKSQSSDRKLNSLEEALTRLSARETEHYRLLHEVSADEVEKDDGSLGALVDILAEVRNKRNGT